MDPVLSTTQVKCLRWICQVCDRECIPIRSESRCLCGHRLKEHETDNYSCKRTNCTCPEFFFIVAEGSWILRCRCKHKHIDHDPITHICSKAKCDCQGFNSPWVCNCNHAWADHRQIVGEKAVLNLKGIVGTGDDATVTAALDSHGGIAEEVNRWDLVKRGSGD